MISPSFRARMRWILLESGIVLTLTFLLVVLAATAGLPSRSETPQVHAAEPLGGSPPSR